MRAELKSPAYTNYRELSRSFILYDPIVPTVQLQMLLILI